ncbi:hypothetical protein GCM10025857_33120 [Alicyclobacillus contaminans]|nr:hypothetical protein GCM10025857_33120 [Alicyclobacillus contaminans]
MKHTAPFIGDIVRKMTDDGIREAVTLVLAPHYSSMSVATYQRAADEAAAGTNLRLWHVDSWHLHPRFLNVLTERVRTAVDAHGNADSVTVLFTAHSLPERILKFGDPYPQQLRETGLAVAEKLNLPHIDFAWQSAGRTNERWLGPDILEKLRALRAAGHRNVVVCAAGFVSDHLEVLYDIDIEAQAVARELGLRLTRTPSLNDDPEFLRALAEVVRQRAAAMNHA